MNRFDIGVVVVTFVALGVSAIIRYVVAPVVRYRIAHNRLAPRATQSAAILKADRGDVDSKDQAR
jgi:hypothetical protein